MDSLGDEGGGWEDYRQLKLLSQRGLGFPEGDSCAILGLPRCLRRRIPDTADTLNSRTRPNTIFRHKDVIPSQGSTLFWHKRVLFLCKTFSITGPISTAAASSLEAARTLAAARASTADSNSAADSSLEAARTSAAGGVSGSRGN